LNGWIRKTLTDKNMLDTAHVKEEHIAIISILKNHFTTFVTADYNGFIFKETFCNC